MDTTVTRITTAAGDIDRDVIASRLVRGGRPPAAAAGQIETAILDHATAAFLRDGYAATSIERIARQARTAKRTLYARWPDKAALFRAVLERMLGRWVAAEPADDAPLGMPEPTLLAMAHRVLAVALTPEALALHRLLVAESARFPELGAMLHRAVAEAGIARVAALLDRFAAAGALPPMDSRFAAEAFLHLVLRGPQLRALGLAPPFQAAELEAWTAQAVRLFLRGIAAGA